MSDDKGVIIEWSVTAIQVGNRHRRDHGEMNPLTASIERHGLLQPITITPEGVPDLRSTTARGGQEPGLEDRARVGPLRPL